jgi:hypothetical protein
MAKASDYKIVTFQRQPGQRPLGVKLVILTLCQPLPVFPRKRTSSGTVGMSQTRHTRPVHRSNSIVDRSHRPRESTRRP